MTTNLPNVDAPHDTPSALRDGPHVQYIEHPEPVAALSSDEASRLDDEQQRATLLESSARCEELSIARAAQLLGDHVSMFGRGPICRELISDARAGRLRLCGRLDRLADGAKRNNPSNAPLERESLRSWIAQYGTDEMRRSAGATWCGFATPG